MYDSGRGCIFLDGLAMFVLHYGTGCTSGSWPYRSFLCGLGSAAIFLWEARTGRLQAWQVGLYGTMGRLRFFLSTASARRGSVSGEALEMAALFADTAGDRDCEYFLEAGFWNPGR